MKWHRFSYLNNGVKFEESLRLNEGDGDRGDDDKHEQAAWSGMDASKQSTNAN